MINPIKEDCCGCEACVQRCPVKCISMRVDDEGFRYPFVNIDLCVNCGACERTCPVINQSENIKYKPIAFSLTAPDCELLQESSSGGAFSLLAQEVIKMGGMVFGARFDNPDCVVHDSADDYVGLSSFRGSKYLPSTIADNFIKVKTSLKNGDFVLFSGTPCQIAGLGLFVGDIDTSRLLTVEVACHGVPSPKVFRAYIDEIEQTLCAKVTSINFRDKRNGWDKYGMSVRGKFCGEEDSKELLYVPLTENKFMQGFIHDLYLRPSCYKCPSKSGKSRADITLADYWGVRRYNPENYNKLGTSLVLVNTDKGVSWIQRLNLSLSEVNQENAVKSNPALIMSAKIPAQRDVFWSKFRLDGIKALNPILSSMRPSLARRTLLMVKSTIRDMMSDKFVATVKSKFLKIN